VAQVDFDGLPQKGGERAETAQTVFQGAQGVRFRAGLCQSFSVLAVKVRACCREDLDSPSKVTCGIAGTSETGQGAAANQESFGVSRVLFEKGVQGSNRLCRALRLEQHLGTQARRNRKLRVEVLRAFVVCERCLPPPLSPVQVAALEIQSRVVRAFAQLGIDES
jgi:hypothetical protein